MFLFFRPRAAAPTTIATTSGPFGPAFPPIPVDGGRVFSYFYPGAFSMWGLGVTASLPGNATWRMGFTLPSGGVPASLSPMLQLWYRSPGTAGSATVNPKWGMAAAGIDPSAVVLSSEGNFGVTWVSSDANKLRKLSIPLDATTITSGMLLLDLLFVSAGWTLAQPSMWLPFIEYVAP